MYQTGIAQEHARRCKSKHPLILIRPALLTQLVGRWEARATVLEAGSRYIWFRTRMLVSSASVYNGRDMG